MNLLDLARSALTDAPENSPESRNAPAPIAKCNDALAGRMPERIDPGEERRRAKAIALLEANPEWRIAVVVEAGDPVIAGVAIRGVVYGELEIPTERYEAAALLALLERYGGEGAPTVH